MRNHAIGPRRFAEVAAVGQVIAGASAFVVAASTYVSYAESPSKAVGGILALASSSALLGMGAIPLLLWRKNGRRKNTYATRRVRQ